MKGTRSLQTDKAIGYGKRLFNRTSIFWVLFILLSIVLPIVLTNSFDTSEAYAQGSGPATNCPWPMTDQWQMYDCWRDTMIIQPPGRGIYIDRNQLAANRGWLNSKGSNMDLNFVWYSDIVNINVGAYAYYEWSYLWGGQVLWDRLGTEFQPGVWLSVYMYGNTFVSNVCGNFTHSIANPAPPRISGYKWNDLNANGVWDSGEPPLQGWAIQLYKGSTYRATTTTNANGYYEFIIDANAGYTPNDWFTVYEVQKSDWVQTNGGGKSVYIPEGSGSVGKNFANNNFGNWYCGTASDPSVTNIVIPTDTTWSTAVQISADPAWSTNLPEAMWVWNTNPAKENSTADLSKIVNLKGKPKSGSVRIFADNDATVYVNNQSAGSIAGFSDPYKTVDIGNLLVIGNNTITIHGHNATGPGGIKASVYISYTTDTTAPITTANLNGTKGNNGWYKSDVEVSLASTDNDGGSGIAKTEYSLDGSYWNTYNVPFTLSAEKTQTIYYRSIDNAGNIEAVSKSMVYSPLNMSSVNNSDVYTSGQSYCVSGCTYPTNPGTSYPDPQYGAIPMDMKSAGVKNAWLSKGSDRTAAFTTSMTLNQQVSQATNIWLVGFDGGWLYWGSPVQVNYVLDGQSYNQTFNPNEWHYAGTDPNLRLWVDKHGCCGDIATARIDLPHKGNLTQVSVVDVKGADAGSIPIFAVTVGQFNGTFKSSDVNIDKTPPVTTDNAPSAWQTSDVTVTLICADNLSGCDTTFWSTDKGASGTGNAIIATEGDTALTYYSVDKAGNREDDHTVHILMDKTSPSTTVEAPSGWQKEDFSITLTCDDEISGCSKTMYRLDSNDWLEGNSVDISVEGDHLLEYHSIDNAGNQEPIKSIHAKLDKTVPLTSATYSGTPGENGYFTSDVTVTLNCADTQVPGVNAVSGCKETLYSFDGQSWNLYQGPIVISGEGQTDLYFHSQDNAGNIEDVQNKQFYIDKTSPTTTDDAPSGWQNQQFIVDLTCSDDGSGCDQTFYSVDDGQWFTGSSIDIIIDGQHKIQYYSADNAGNREATKMVQVYLDTVAPNTTESHTGTSGENGYFTSDVTVTLNCADTQARGVNTVSGCKETEYSFDGENWTVYLSPVVIDDEGTTTLYYRSLDNAGNLENADTLEIKIDRIPPVISDANEDPGCGEVKIVWVTDEPATSRVEYSATAGGPYASVSDNTLTLNHALVITGLNAGSTYYYRTISKDIAGNISISSEDNFTTEGGKANLQIINVASHWANLFDFINRQLTVTYTLANQSGIDSVKALVTKVDASNGVTVSSTLPYTIGDIDASGSNTFSLRYKVPLLDADLQKTQVIMSKADSIPKCNTRSF